MLGCNLKSFSLPLYYSDVNQGFVGANDREHQDRVNAIVASINESR